MNTRWYLSKGRGGDLAIEESPDGTVAGAKRSCRERRRAYVAGHSDKARVESLKARLERTQNG